MLKNLARFVIPATALLWATQASAASIGLFESLLNVDGTLTSYLEPVGSHAGSGVDDSGFDYVTGLGVISVTVTGAGGHNVDLVVDHEITEGTNTFFNELGDEFGTAAAGQSWQIDGPSFDIFLDTEDSTLQSVNWLAGLEDDVAMALGWDFTLAAGDTAVATFTLSQDAPTGGFHLRQSDADAPETIFFSSSLDITGVPTPAGVALFGVALLGLAATRRRRLLV